MEQRQPQPPDRRGETQIAHEFALTAEEAAAAVAQNPALPLPTLGQVRAALTPALVPGPAFAAEPSAAASDFAGGAAGERGFARPVIDAIREPSPEAPPEVQPAAVSAAAVTSAAAVSAVSAAAVALPTPPGTFSAAPLIVPVYDDAAPVPEPPPDPPPEPLVADLAEASAAAETVTEDETDGPAAADPAVEADRPPLPAELRRFNWGAFLLTWVWGLGNHVPRALWAALPLGPLPLLMMWYLGKHGNELAWRARHWPETEHFDEAQSIWTSIGIVTYAGLATLLLVLKLDGVFTTSQPLPGIGPGMVTTTGQAAAAQVPLPVDTRLDKPLAPIGGGYLLQPPLGWQVTLEDTGRMIVEPVDAELLKRGNRFTLQLSSAASPEEAASALRASAIRESGGSYAGEKSLKAGEQPAIIVLYTAAGHGDETRHAQLFAVQGASGAVVTGISDVHEQDWPRLEAMIERSLRSVRVE